MASRFWVGGTGNTNDTAHWSATTGGAGGETVPVAGDSVTFDSNSGTAATVTVDVALSAASITINKSDLTLIHSAGTTLTGAMTLTTGTLNTNGQTCSWGSFSSSNGNTRTLTLGASAITLTGTGTGWDTGSVSNLTVTANTAVISSSTLISIGLGSKNYNGLSFVLTGAGVPVFYLGTGVTIGSMTRGGTAVKTSGLRLSNLLGTASESMTLSGTCTVGGNTTQGVNRLLVSGFTVGSQATITAAAYVMSGDVDFMDINLAYSGGASWTNAGSAYIGDALGNSGAVTTNANVSATQTATGTASFTWSTHGWTSRVPLPQDDVVINNAFVAGRTITQDMPRAGRSIDFTGTTGTPAWNLTVQWTMYGSLTMIAGMTFTGSFNSIFAGRSGGLTITSAGRAFPTDVYINAPNGSYTCQDLFSVTLSTFRPQYGTFTASSAGLICGNFASTSSAATRVINGGTGTWTLDRTGAFKGWTISDPTNLTINFGSTTIDITSTDSAAFVFQGGGKTYGTLRHTATGTGALTITGNNTFANLDLECTTARTITFPSGGTQTITGTLTLLGASGQLLSLRSSATPTKWYINAATTSAQYCDVKDSTASGTGTPINDTTGGVDSGNNIGWLFVAGGSAGYSSTLLTLGVG